MLAQHLHTATTHTNTHTHIHVRPNPQDATLFHCLMLRNGIGSLTLVGRGAATDTLVSHLLPKEYSMMMGPGVCLLLFVLCVSNLCIFAKVL